MENNKIEQLKKEHGDVYEVKCTEDDGTEIYCYLRKPNRNDLRPVLALLDVDRIRANELLLNTCWIEGDERIKTKDEFFFQASAVLGELLKVKIGEIKKL